MTDNSIMSEIAKRIQDRLDFLGKSASAASLEAGLGRSALQDILTGKSQNPRLDTLRKLTVPLECSLSYLSGDPPERLAKAPQIEWGEQENFGDAVHRTEVVGSVEAGTIRASEEDFSEFNPVVFLERDQRFPNSDLFGYVVNDRGLAHLNIQPENDVLFAVAPSAFSGPVRTGSILIVERLIPNAFDADDHTGIETTAREVQYVGEELHLTMGGSSKPIIIPAQQVSRFVSGDLLERPMVRFVGLVVRLIREMPV